MNECLAEAGKALLKMQAEKQPSDAVLGDVVAAIRLAWVELLGNACGGPDHSDQALIFHRLVTQIGDLLQLSPAATSTQAAVADRLKMYRLLSRSLLTEGVETVMVMLETLRDAMSRGVTLAEALNFYDDPLRRSKGSINLERKPMPTTCRQGAKDQLSSAVAADIAAPPTSAPGAVCRYDLCHTRDTNLSDNSHAGGSRSCWQS